MLGRSKGQAGAPGVGRAVLPLDQVLNARRAVLVLKHTDAAKVLHLDDFAGGGEHRGGAAGKLLTAPPPLERWQPVAARQAAGGWLLAVGGGGARAGAVACPRGRAQQVPGEWGAACGRHRWYKRDFNSLKLV